MIVIPLNLVNELFCQGKNYIKIKTSFVNLDDGDVYLSSEILKNINKIRYPLVSGSVIFQLNTGKLKLNDQKTCNKDFIRIIINCNNLKSDFEIDNFEISAQIINQEGVFVPHPIQIIPLKEEIFSRIHGLYETDVLRSKTVLVIGLGSGGAPITIELAKAGVGNFILIDPDRLEAANIIRHVCGIADIGRYKTKALRDLILSKNPIANIELHEKEVNWEWLSELGDLVSKADIVFAATDNRLSRVLINHVCLEYNKICIYGGAFRRAYGGQVLKIIPNKTMCYQCFIDTIVDDPDDIEISSQTQAERIAYSDRLVPIEPGLSTDIAPISLMCVKLGILELLRGSNTSFSNLYEDLSAPLYLWLNRREENSPYDSLNPLDTDDGLRILAWYGIENEKNPHCPVCGDFMNYKQSSHNSKINKSHKSHFDPNIKHKN